MTGREGMRTSELRQLSHKGLKPAKINRFRNLDEARLPASTDALNESAFGTMIVCPVTTTERPGFRWRPGLLPGDLRVADREWIPKPHWVATDQIVTVDASARAIRLLAAVADDGKMKTVDDSLRLLLDL